MAVPDILTVSILKKKQRMNRKVSIIGGGLAGVEAAFQIAKRNIEVDLFEMRPLVMTEAHQTDLYGEMVCSNSLGATELTSASGLLKQELKLLNSFFLKIAEENRVPAGNSFSVDRIKLAEQISTEIEAVAGINLIRQEIKDIDHLDGVIIIATGPLTSPDFSHSLTRLTMRKNLFFFDATSPIVRSDSINFSKVYRASRYNKGDADFINIPLTEEQYDLFVNELKNAEKVEEKDFEKRIFFEPCLPVEEIACRGDKTLAFGTLKPVGLKNPKTNQLPHAVAQLRQDDLKNDFYQLVGFQTRLKQAEQKRIFRKLPGLEKAQFERYGRMHRNTYINAPLVIDSFFQCKTRENVFFAGQICGVEGYIESVCSGLVAGIFAAKKTLGQSLIELPESTACGALIQYITRSSWKNFRPTKFTFGLLPEIQKMKLSPEGGSRKKLKKREKKEIKAALALKNLKKWMKQSNI